MTTKMRSIMAGVLAGLALAAGSAAAGNKPEMQAGFSAGDMEWVNARVAKATRIANGIRAASPMDDAQFLALSQALLGASDAGLEAAAGATSAKAAYVAIRSAGGMRKALGNDTTEFVFRPIVPCRLLDTRANGVMVAGGVPYTVDFDGGNPGNAANCTFAGTGIIGFGRAAMAINLTVTQPTGPGFIQARPVGSTNVTSNQNFSAGQTIANFVVVQDAGTIAEFELFASIATHAIVDVMGVFTQTTATPLDCVMVNGPDTVVAAGSTGANSSPAACPAGYTEVAKYCRTSSFASELSGFNGPNFNGACNWRNPTAGGITVNTDIRCCRLPGA